MSPRWFLALAYLGMGLSYLYQALLAHNNDAGFHLVVPYVQAGLCLLAIIAAVMLPSMNSLFVHWISIALLAAASTILTVYALNQDGLFWTAHAAQSAGLLIAAWYVIQWWLSTGGVRWARRISAGYLVASLGALAMIGLEFIGEGHPFQRAQRPYAAAADGVLAVSLLLAAWMSGVCALTLKTPESVVEPDAPDAV